MRPTALLGLTLLLPLAMTGCGDTWWNPPLTGGYSPHLPVGDADNMRRVMGQDAPTTALESEPGDVWPGPLPPSPTLRDMEGLNGIGTAAQQPNYGNGALPAPNPARGGSIPATSAYQPPAALAPAGMPPSRPVLPTARNPAGQTLPTAAGPSVVTGGTDAYKTAVTPGGGSAIVVPNGNGTSTVIHPDGHIETIPTPK